MFEVYCVPSQTFLFSLLFLIKIVCNTLPLSVSLCLSHSDTPLHISSEELTCNRISHSFSLFRDCMTTEVPCLLTFTLGRQVTLRAGQHSRPLPFLGFSFSESLEQELFSPLFFLLHFRASVFNRRWMSFVQQSLQPLSSLHVALLLWNSCAGFFFVSFFFSHHTRRFI